MEQPLINEHHKQEDPRMHSAEHILNGTMVKTFGCNRSCSAHVERTKSKLDYVFPRPLTDVEIRTLEDKVNAVIEADVPVRFEFVNQSEVAQRFDLERLPDGATHTVRIVYIGDYDECLCAGIHVEHTAQIGRFRISSTRYREGKLRIVFRLDAAV